VLDDGEALEKLKIDARRALRDRYRKLRAAFPSAALAERSQRVVTAVRGLDAFEAAASVGLFWPISAEVDLRGLDAEARARNKSVFYPVMDPKPDGGFSTGFARVHDPSELVERGRRFPEPAPEAPRAERGEIELIVVPALAVTDTGHRLGYGRGFYDVTLPDFCPPALSVVVAFDFQLLAELPVLEHDVACDMVVTDARVIQAEQLRA
jgi:5-formyltetrahydrofolate cyclo-ligase